MITTLDEGLISKPFSSSRCLGAEVNPKNGPGTSQGNAPQTQPDTSNGASEGVFYSCVWLKLSHTHAYAPLATCEDCVYTHRLRGPPLLLAVSK